MELTWILCPECGGKTRVKLRPDTELRNFPLFCPKCRKEFVIDAIGQQVAVVKETEPINWHIPMCKNSGDKDYIL